MFQKIWNWCGNVKITFYLFLFISLNLVAGSYFIKFNSALFNPLNHLLLQEWLIGYGINEPFKILWLGSLLGLLTLLGINTLVCAWNRIRLLWPKRTQMPFKIFSIKVTPSLIHLCFLVILAGHFISLIQGYNAVLSAKPGESIRLPDRTEIKILEQQCEYYQFPPALQQSIKQCTVTLGLFSGARENTKIYSITRSVVDPQFRYDPAYRFYITSQAKLQTGDPGKFALAPKDLATHSIT
ncbi:MAG: hypothetical protein HY879_10880 [Deltaproteobacteria bacterium]|nr:hypothetical protein [Deltaproteobacteria bacterium]